MTESVKAYTNILNLSGYYDEVFMFFCFHAPVGFLQSCKSITMFIIMKQVSY